MDQRTGYAKAPDGRYLAYAVTGTAPLTVLSCTTTMTSFEALDEEPHYARFLRRLTAFARVVRFDLRGVGLSDPIDPNERPTVEQIAADAVAVLDAVEAREFAIVAEGASGLWGVTLAANVPTRVSHLVLLSAYARVFRTDDYPIGHSAEVIEAFAEKNADPNEKWAFEDGEVVSDDVALMAPSLAGDAVFREWWVRASRRSASPATATAWITMNSYADVRALLPTLSVPTLVVHRSDDRWMPVGHGRYLGEHVPGAKYVELEGADTLGWTRPGDELLGEVEEFLTGRRSGSTERVLASVLFTDIVDSTGRAAALGDEQWRALLDTHDSIVRAELQRYDGREVNTTGDGFLGAFESPTQAVRCARAIVESAATRGVAVRAGAHTGECERRGDDLAGLTVHIAARVAALAASGEVLVSRTVRDLVSGSELRFAPRGEYELKGVPEAWQLFALDR